MNDDTSWRAPRKSTPADDARLRAVVADMRQIERDAANAYVAPEWTDEDVARIFDADDPEVKRLTRVDDADPEVSRLARLARDLDR
ncbi:hypothetical protein [Microbacterium allomyrinae]|uniref:Uncharacterized protein n=1 Tax=Microbacterium allomyrinae TaxID=2830666 RepID=A0A9X1LU01_9MICO|nr:hypothetical protein [Microbacterium allomyrinae]MCC2031945.1 hypothetical protein [Microbacterium allomyrinae]